MKHNMPTIAPIASALCALVMIGAVCLWAPPCQGTIETAAGAAMPMKCVYTGKIAILVAGLIVIVCVASLAAKRPMTAAVIALSAACILLTVDTPVSIGICKEGMACSTMALWLRGAAALSIASSVLGFALDGTRKRVKG